LLALFFSQGIGVEVLLDGRYLTHSTPNTGTKMKVITATVPWCFLFQFLSA
jgi:hypothetical protein